jgi:virulence-associated protein VagC
MNHHARPGTPGAPRLRLETSAEGQILHIPPALGFPAGVTEVDVVREGDTLVLKPVTEPKSKSWDDFFNSPPASDDFMRERDQGEFEKREPLD